MVPEIHRSSTKGFHFINRGLLTYLSMILESTDLTLRRYLREVSEVFVEIVTRVEFDDKHDLIFG